MEYSILRRLPPELRCQVYEYVCYEESGVNIVRSKQDGTRPTRLLQSRGLLSSCRQIRDESLASFNMVNTFHFRTSLLGPNFKLVHGQRICSSNVAAAVHDLQDWLREMGNNRCSVEVDLGVWFTWWERTTSKIVAEIIRQITAAVRSTRAQMSIRFTVEWCAIPVMKHDFEVVLPLSNLEAGRRVVQLELAKRDEWLAAQFERHCMQENMATCRKKLDELFDTLSTAL